MAAGKGPPSHLQLIRYSPDGSVDPTFGNAGAVVTPGTSGGDGIYSLLIRSSGKILVGGSKDAKFVLIQYNSNGSLDSTFGTNGIVSTPVSITGALSSVSSLVIRPDGKILAGGYVHHGLPGDPYAQVIRGF